MVIADFIALCVVLGLLGIGGKSIFSVFKLRGEKLKVKASEQEAMRKELHDAVVSHDYSKIDDFILVWGDKMGEGAVELLKQRRNDLYINSSDKPKPMIGRDL